jgi:hypothetical protein
MPAKHKDFSLMLLLLNHYFQSSYEEKSPIEANSDFYNKTMQSK